MPFKPILSFFFVPTVLPIAPAGPKIEAFIIGRIPLFLDTLYSKNLFIQGTDTVHITLVKAQIQCILL